MSELIGGPLDGMKVDSSHGVPIQIPAPPDPRMITKPVPDFPSFDPIRISGEYQHTSGAKMQWTPNKKLGSVTLSDKELARRLLVQALARLMVSGRGAAAGEGE